MVYRVIVEAIRLIDREIVRLAEEVYGDSYSLIRSVPGIGWLLGALILAEIDNVSRFSRADCLKSYAGLAPRLRLSAGVARYGRCRIANPYLRWAFYEAAVVAVRVDAELRDFYFRFVGRG